MKYIAISVSIHNVVYKTKTVLEKLKEIADTYKGEDVTLIHCFPQQKEIDLYLLHNPADSHMGVLNASLNQYFPKQICLSDPDTSLRELRQLLLAKVTEHKATAYIVGDVRDGVCEEAWLYEQNKVDIIYLPIKRRGVTRGKVVSK